MRHVGNASVSRCASAPLHNGAMTHRQPDPAPGAEPERGFAVACLPPAHEASELAELQELARTAGLDTVGELVQHRGRPDPRTYVGKGKLEELKAAFANAEAEVLVVDDELAPPQQRRLEDVLEARVVDRTQLILDIFAQHAVTAEGKLQVELAQLEYNLPRMRGMWKHLERLGGGVGTRGTGGEPARDRPPPRTPADLRSQGEAEGALEAARHTATVSRPFRDADDRARRLHERRQVHAAQRVHRRGRLRRRPACSRRWTRRRGRSSTRAADIS